MSKLTTYWPGLPYSLAFSSALTPNEGSATMSSYNLNGHRIFLVEFEFVGESYRYRHRLQQEKATEGESISQGK
jgi:hypothetical protein